MSRAITRSGLAGACLCLALGLTGCASTSSTGTTSTGAAAGTPAGASGAPTAGATTCSTAAATDTSGVSASDAGRRAEESWGSGNYADALVWAKKAAATADARGEQILGIYGDGLCASKDFVTGENPFRRSLSVAKVCDGSHSSSKRTARRTMVSAKQSRSMGVLPMPGEPFTANSLWEEPSSLEMVFLRGRPVAGPSADGPADRSAPPCPPRRPA
ncbi:hypothetical protein [Streptomyces fulvoviolaceus]|uniref:hypothetical protein n=1 Tax=Streptomyces fulvoviolaceus TaxID=285535 RepID=UPI0004C985DD|nr:hypothetical protein [Streptomyces fulvoviolaceus]